MNRRYYQHQTDTKDYKRARELRRDSSSIEQVFWYALRQAAATRKLKFRRQQPIHPYIADFACMQAKLLIELDGMSHDTRVDYDQKRDAYLQSRGYKIMRITNEEAVVNLTGAVEAVIMRAEELLKSIAPSPAKTKDLTSADAEVKSKFLLPLPQGERKPALDPRIDFETRET